MTDSEKLLEYLKKTPERFASRKELMTTFYPLPDAYIRGLVSDLAIAEHPVVFGAKGYTYTNDPELIDMNIASLKSRQAAIQRRINGLIKAKEKQVVTPQRSLYGAE